MAVHDVPAVKAAAKAVGGRWLLNYKHLSVISINGFIIALTRQLSVNGVNDFDFYDRIFNGWTIDFSKDGFKYTSSQYRKFSTQILREVFQISDEIIATI